VAVWRRQPALEAGARELTERPPSSSSSSSSSSSGVFSWAAAVAAAALPTAAGSARALLANAATAARPLSAAEMGVVGMVLKLLVLGLALAGGVGSGAAVETQAAVMEVLLVLLLHAAAPEAPTAVRCHERVELL
jgi:uncharacterized membrane protein